MFSKFSKPFFLCLFLLVAAVCAMFFYFSKNEKNEYVQLSEVKHASHADYVFLQDASNREWIFKQIVEPSPDDQLAIILELFAADIAKAVHFPINSVRLISVSDDFKHRIFNQFPGSLHLKVPGKSIEEKSPWDDFDIHQKFRTPFIAASKGPLDPEEVGLRKIVIQNMAKHPDLQKIVALDTYLGNIDRSQGNIFYDTVTNRFYGIDMGTCLMCNLAEFAQEKLEKFASESIPFSDEEYEALQGYRQALLTLLSKYPPQEMVALLKQNLESAGFIPSNTLLWNEDAERRVNKWKAIIEQNYQSSLLLVNFLENYTNKHRSKKELS